MLFSVKQNSTPRGLLVASLRAVVTVVDLRENFASSASSEPLPHGLPRPLTHGRLENDAMDEFSWGEDVASTFDN